MSCGQKHELLVLKDGRSVERIKSKEKRSTERVEAIKRHHK